MKKALIWILATILVVGFYIGAYFLYDFLKGQADATDLTDMRETTVATDENSADPQPKEEVSSEAVPDFTVYDAEGKAYKLSDFFGKPIVLNLWASWCGPCKSEMPGFQQVYDAKGDDVAFLMINVTGIDTQADAKQFISDNGYTFPVYYDTEGSMAVNYYGGSVPMTYFIAANGELVTYATGAITQDILEQGVQMIME